MKSLIVLAVLVAVIGALPADQDYAAIILKSENTNIGAHQIFCHFHFQLQFN